MTYVFRGQQLPPLLTTLSGATIRTAEPWLAHRRAELVQLFTDHIYGQAPAADTYQLTWQHVAPQVEQDNLVLAGKARKKQVQLTVQGPHGSLSWEICIVIPKSSGGQPPASLPTFLLINHHPPRSCDDNLAAPPEYWPVADIITRGYAAILYHAQQVTPDDAGRFQQGIHRLFSDPHTPRAAHDWGTIAAWAWGASRIMDYVVQDPDLDHTRVAVVGHSRSGKTALWAGAQDERFKMVVSNNSGCTGASIARGTTGETIHAINERFPHWFAPRYRQYNHQPNALPVDQHQLLALIAPRLLYVASASDDAWADPEAEFHATCLTSDVYRLFGIDTLQECSEHGHMDTAANEDLPFPAPGQALHSARVGYHLRPGPHALTRYDWQHFMDFADSRL